MRRTSIFLLFIFLTGAFVNAQNVPELMYYKFENNSSNTTPNYASAPVGTNPAPVLGHTFTSGGEFDSCMSGTGGSGSTSSLNTGWNCNLGSGNWTISFWVSNLVDLNPTYLFGDPGSTSFRCFYGGAAQPNNMLLRGPMSDILIPCPMPGSHVFHIVYNGTNVLVYRNGVLLSTNPRTINMPTGTGFKIGGYSTSSFSMSGKMDEWRLYNRALNAAEITATWNHELPLAPTVCNYYSSAWCPAGTFPNLPAATYFQASEWLGDTLYVHAPSSTGAASTTIYRYKWGGTWSTGVPLPVARVGGSLTACNGKLYYIGGGATSVTTGTNTVYEYNPSTGAWTPKANMPAVLAAHTSQNWGDSVIFVWGGPYTGSATNLAVHYYRVGSNTWGTISNSIPSGQGRRTFAAGISGNKLIMSCGYNTTYLKNTYVGTIGSNASQLTWASAPDCPTTYTGLSRPGGASYDRYFYMIAGEQAGGGYHQTAYVFIFATNTWHPTTIQPKPTGMSNIFNACVAKCINDTVRVFVPGGYSGSASANFEVIACGPTITGNSTIISNIPNVYSLSQNYPNPFNPTTKISFSLPKNGDVRLVVYDILGKEVATLVNDYRTAGTHQVVFDASNLASGVYLYTITVNDFVETKRMMLIK